MDGRDRQRPAPQVEEAGEGLNEGDVPFTPGTARAALAVRDFRVVWLGAFSSNIGTWMQNVVLGAYAFELTRSPAYVSLVAFAQLGPLLVLSVVGGLLADTVDRRRLLVGAQLVQLLGSLALAALVLGDDPSRAGIVAAVFVVGAGNALNAPAWVAMLPELAGRENMAGAISLNSTQMNASRVVGPAIGGLLFPVIGAAGVFTVNAVTYLFVIASLLAIRPPRAEVDASETRGFRRLLGGFAVARRDRLVRRALVSLTIFSFLCLPFTGQMPTIAAENLDMRPKSLAYGLLYASFGLGAVLGAVSIGTFLAARSKAKIMRTGMAVFAVALAAFALLRTAALAYPLVLVIGFAYFATVTSLNTVLQVHLDPRVRGRVMSLWLMAFGGTVPLGLLAAGPVAEATSITVVLLYGAVVAAGLAVYAHVTAVRGTGAEDEATEEAVPA
ncbi:MAG TPA: MFS transporter [Acidimicrobiales bacterium]|nr:MFS transporter [Acidimicrobiales bacterium]